MNDSDRSLSGHGALALFNLGFRPFFLCAGLFAALGALLWTGIYTAGWQIAPAFPAMTWHAHEMIYGYSLAVIAGFLLTAVKNWTGRQTARGYPLLGLVVLWLLPRLIAFTPVPNQTAVLALLDLAFIVALSVAVAVPIIQSRARRQSGILAKLVLLGAGNALFYAGVFGWLDEGIHMGLYLGLYLIVALILTMGRRVIPSFTERGVGYAVTLHNWRWLDIASMVLFLLFMVSDVFFNARTTAAALALALFLLYGIRLWGWHTAGLWRKPLLWSLYVGYAFIVAGFPLYAASVFLGVSPFLSVHAFAFGGIGVVTLSMMARVSLGHTGRNVHRPPVLMGYCLALLGAGTIVRVVFPLFEATLYPSWVAVSGIMWIMAFAGFVLVYFPILTSPRIDGQPG